MGNEKPKFFTFRDLHSIKQTPIPDPRPLEPTSESTNTVISVDFEQQTVSANQTQSINQTLYVSQASESVPQTQSDQQTPSVHLALTNNINGYTSIPNLILDGLVPMLRVQEQAVYLRLYRLSHGFHNNSCRIGFDKLAQSCNLSRREVIRSIEKLEQLGLVVRLGCNFKSGNGVVRGNLYQLNLPKLIDASPTQSANQTQSSNSALNANMSPIKDDDDPLKKQDHHQSEHEKRAMMIYQEITGNSWTKADIATYNKIKNIPLQAIETAIKLATQRASSPPNSLAYFVKEIINTANPPKQNRTQRKKVLEKIVQQVRNSFIGSNYSISDFTFKVKEVCLREDINFDNDIFDDIMSKKNP